MSAEPHPSDHPRSTWSTVAAVSLVAGLALYVTVPAFRQLQADSFRDLYLGRWIAQHGIPHQEAFALANRGRAWIDQQWLADLIGYEAWRVGGYRALALLDAGAFALAYAILAGLMRRRGASVALAISFGAFAMVSGFSLVFIRAQMLALPLFAALLWLCLTDLEHARPAPRLVLVLPLLVLWSNVHGSTLLGACLAALYLAYRAASSARRRARATASIYGGLAVAAALTPIATPYGIHVLHYYGSFVGNQAVRLADLEWGPPVFPELSFFQLVVPLMLALGSLALARARGQRQHGVLLGGVLVTEVAACLALRNNVWLGMIAAVLTADTAAAWIPTRDVTRGFLTVVGLLAAALALLGIGRLATRSIHGYESLAPTRAIDAAAKYAAGHPCSRLLADNLSVSALLWHDPWLAGRVAFDGRIELYPRSALLTWVAFQGGESSRWPAIIRPYQLLIGSSSQDPALVARLGALPGGSVLGRDSRGVAILNAAARRCAPQVTVNPSVGA